MVDGTPSFAAAEAFKLRAITKDWRIVEVLLRVSLLTKAPDAQGLAASFEVTMKDFGLLVKHLRVVMKDRAATNQAAINFNLIHAKYGIKPFAADCNPHTVSHVPEKFKGPCYEKMRKQFGKMIMHGGNSPLQFLQVFGMLPKKGRGVRFYVHWEQCCQLHLVGLARLYEEVVKVCVERKWAEKSAKKFQALAEQPTIMGRATVECCATATAGRQFCQPVDIRAGSKATGLWCRKRLKSWTTYARSSTMASSWTVWTRRRRKLRQSCNRS